LSVVEDDGEGADVQTTNLWKLIDESLQMQKRESQTTYKQLLDDQVKHKEMLGRQGNMTQVEQSLNSINSLQEFKTMVPGLCQELPFKN